MVPTGDVRAFMVKSLHDLDELIIGPLRKKWAAVSTKGLRSEAVGIS